MTRLIDADALKEVIYNNLYTITDFFNRQDRGMFWTAGIEKAIDEAPTIDAVRVVRCKDCKYRDADDFCTGRGYPNMLVPDDGFCEKGARREE